MQNIKIIGVIGALALLSNIFIPGMAFGQSTTGNQTGSLNLACGSLSITSVPGTSFSLNIIEPASGGYRHAYAQTFEASPTYQNGTTALDPIGGIHISDTRTAGATCINNGTTEGFVLSATASDFSNGTDTLPVENNFFIATTNNINTVALSGYSLHGTGATALYYSDSINYSGAYDVTSPIHLTDDQDLTTPATFTTLSNNNLKTLEGVTLLKNGTGAGANDYKYMGAVVFPAFYLRIPQSQNTGIYSSTITYNLSPST